MLPPPGLHSRRGAPPAANGRFPLGAWKLQEATCTQLAWKLTGNFPSSQSLDAEACQAAYGSFLLEVWKLQEATQQLGGSFLQVCRGSYIEASPS